MAPPTRGTTTANASILEQISGRKKAKIRIKNNKKNNLEIFFEVILYKF